MSESNRSQRPAEKPAAAEPAAHEPDPNSRAGLSMMIGFFVLLGLVALLGWATNPP